MIGRAKNLVSIAQPVEQAFLAALERRDAETYNLLKASHDLQLAGATIDLHALQVSEAAQGWSWLGARSTGPRASATPTRVGSTPA